jgi:hypothetical protein
MLCDLDRLHAGTETHGSVGLRKTTGHTTRDTSEEVRRTERLGVVLGLGCDEEEDGTLGGGLDPGPRDKTLVDCSVLSARALRHQQHIATHSQQLHRVPRCG